MVVNILSALSVDSASAVYGFNGIHLVASQAAIWDVVAAPYKECNQAFGIS